MKDTALVDSLVTNMWPDLQKPGIMTSFGNPYFSAVSFLYLKPCSVAISMLYSKYFMSYNAK